LEIRPVLHAHLFKHAAILVERMCRQIETDGGEFAMQLVRSRPRLAGWQNQLFGRSAPHAKNVSLPGCGILLGPRRHTHHSFEAGEQLRTVIAEAVKRSCRYQAFENSLANDPWIDA